MTLRLFFINTLWIIVRAWNEYTCHLDLFRIKSVCRKYPGSYSEQEIEKAWNEAREYLKETPFPRPVGRLIRFMACVVTPILFPFGTIIIR